VSLLAQAPVGRSLAEQVAEAANLVGLMLALVTLFTSEQGRRLADERSRQGGPRPGRLRSVRLVCVALAVVTVGALVALAPLVLDVLRAVGDAAWEPVLAVFVLTYLLLGALLVWQVALAVRSR
jgi:hypothetical protein